MKSYSVYLDTKTGRSQVTFEAETVEVKEHTYEFRVGGDISAVFSRERCFGFVEERGHGNWEERPEVRPPT